MDSYLETEPHNGILHSAPEKWALQPCEFTEVEMYLTLCRKTTWEDNVLPEPNIVHSGRGTGRLGIGNVWWVVRYEWGRGHSRVETSCILLWARTHGIEYGSQPTESPTPIMSTCWLRWLLGLMLKFLKNEMKKEFSIGRTINWDCLYKTYHINSKIKKRTILSSCNSIP